MPHIFTNAEYANMLHVYVFCDGSATTGVEEYRQRLPMRRILDRRVFSKFLNALLACFSVLMFHLERVRQQPVVEQESILEIVQRSPTTSTRRLSTRLVVSRTRVWRTLHEDCWYSFHPQREQNPHPGDSAMHLEFCHRLYSNRQLLPLIPFTDEAAFTLNGTNNTRNSHRWSQNNPHGTLETKFQHRFSINVWCGMIDDMLIGPVILDDRMIGQNYVDFLQ